MSRPRKPLSMPPRENLESPFLDEEILPVEVTSDFTSGVARLVKESPFERVSIGSPPLIRRIAGEWDDIGEAEESRHDPFRYDTTFPDSRFRLEGEVETDIKRAVERNSLHAKKLRWDDRAEEIKGFLKSDLGLSSISTPEDFVRAVAAWQQSQGDKKPDGILGPITWDKLQKAMKQANPPPVSPPQISSMSNAAKANPVKRGMKFEIQTQNVIFRNDGKCRVELKRKFGPLDFLRKTSIELQSESDGYVEFETASWSDDWCDVKAQLLEALDMVKQMDGADLIKTCTNADGRTVRVVKFPWDTKHLVGKKAEKDDEDTLTPEEWLEVEIVQPTAGKEPWPARIQVSESFALSQFESYLRDHTPQTKADDLVAHAEHIRDAANTASVPNADLVNLYNLILIVVMYIKEIEKQTQRNEEDMKYDTKGEKPPLAKEHLLLMSRTNFHWMYKTFLTDEERKLFRKVVDEKLIPAELGRHNDDELFRKGYNGGKPANGKKLTIKNWLVSIYAETQDQLSTLEGKDNDAMGRFPFAKVREEGEKATILKADRHYVRFEARWSKHGNDRPASQWLDYLLKVFKSAHDLRGDALSYHPAKCPGDH